MRQRGSLLALASLLVLGAATHSAAQESAPPGGASQNIAPQIRAPENLTLLQGDALHNAFSDRTMDGIYKQIRQRTGTARFTESFLPSGGTLYREGKIIEKGRWRLSGPPGFETVICFRYGGTMAGPASCFTVFKNGTCLYSYAPSLVRGGQPLDTNRWSAKTIIRGEISSCDDLIS
jgi:hypothetical protein